MPAPPHLNGSNAQTPDVCALTVPLLSGLNHLWSHPVGGQEAAQHGKVRAKAAHQGNTRRKQCSVIGQGQGHWGFAVEHGRVWGWDHSVRGKGNRVWAKAGQGLSMGSVTLYGQSLWGHPVERQGHQSSGRSMAPGSRYGLGKGLVRRRKGACGRKPVGQ